MSKNTFIKLLQKKLTGQLSVSEQQDLATWKQASKEQQALADDIERIWEAGAVYKNDYQPDVNKGLALLKHKIKQEQTTTNDKLTPLLQKRSPWFVRSAAAVLVLLAAGFLLKSTFLNPSPELLVAQTAIGETKTLELVDGSTITLNEGSRLRYPKTFSASQRQVQLDGEAFFDIERNEQAPFNIKTNHTSIEVLGTSFNVRAIAEESTTEVAVQTGKVRVTASKGDENIMLLVGDKGIYNHRTQVLQKVDQPSQNALAWMSHQLSFDKTPLATIVQDLERYFKVEINLQNKQLEQCTYTSPFNQPDIEEILNVLSIAFGSDLEQTAQDAYTLSGGQCN